MVSNRAGVQIMGDWAKGEFSAAGQVAGREFGCFPGFGPKAPYIVAGDALPFSRSSITSPSVGLSVERPRSRPTASEDVTPHKWNVLALDLRAHGSRESGRRE